MSEREIEWVIGREYPSMKNDLRQSNGESYSFDFWSVPI